MSVCICTLQVWLRRRQSATNKQKIDRNTPDTRTKHPTMRNLLDSDFKGRSSTCGHGEWDFISQLALEKSPQAADVRRVMWKVWLSNADTVIYAMTLWAGTGRKMTKPRTLCMHLLLYRHTTSWKHIPTYTYIYTTHKPQNHRSA